MLPKVEQQIRKIESELTDSLANAKPATSYNVRQIIRNKVLQVYDLGCQYACNKLGVQPFAIAEDFRHIGKMTDDVYRWWLYSKNVQSALISLTSITLAQATKNKARQIVSGTTADGNLVIPAHTLTAKALFRQDFNSLDISTTEEDIAPPSTAQVLIEWVTEQDSLVCPTCEALEGQQWEVDDPDIPTPVSDSHINCRCRLDIVTQTD